MKRTFLYYLLCQVLGWGIIFFVMVWVAPGSMHRALSMVLPGLLVTHCMRAVIIRRGWLNLPWKAVWFRLPVLVLFSAIVMMLLEKGVFYYFNVWGFAGVSPMKIIAYMFDVLLLLVPWTLTYYLYHYVKAVQMEIGRAGKLEMRVREMEQKSEGGVTSLETMMEILLKIQRSVEEDPGRCREEITAFSKLLREGYLS